MKIKVMYNYPAFLLASVQVQVKGKIIEGFYGDFPMTVWYGDVIMTTRSLAEAKEKWSGDDFTYEDGSLPKVNHTVEDKFTWAINPYEIKCENNVLSFKDLQTAKEMARSILRSIADREERK